MQTILIIDDEAAFRETTAAALQAHGFQTIEAENGRAGVRLAQEHVPALILSDVQMGSFDGFAALAAIRYHPVTATIPVILMTGAPDDAGRRFAMDLGADDYLAKPFSIGALTALIRVQLKKREAIRSQGVKPSPDDQAELKALADSAESVGQKSEMTAGRTPNAASGMRLDAETAPVAVEIYLQMLDAYHPTLGNASRRSVVLCRSLGVALKLSSGEMSGLIWAAALSDIALVRASHNAVRRWLRHPHSLHKEELIQIQEHPEHSRLMLEPWPIFEFAGRIIAAHHESWDGTGFPAGLKGERIPPLAQVLAAANYYCSRYDAHPSICAELELQSGYLFDPKIVPLVKQAAAETPLPGGEREILVTELREGLVLAQDLRNSSGMALLPKGRRITSKTVARLMSINRVRPMAQTILVYS